MKLRRFLVILTVAMLLVALPLAVGNAQKRLIRLTFYYPVGVSGPLATVINTYVDEFNAANPDIEVVPVYTGDYDPTMQKVQTAVMGGNPPDVFIVEISELPTLLAMNACEPLDRFASPDTSASSSRHSWRTATDRTASSTTSRSSVAPQCSTGTRSTSGRQVWIPISRPPPGKR